MALPLYIDTAGGANFEGFHLRNVASLHVGGPGIASETLQVSGTFLVSGAVTIGTLTVNGSATITGSLAWGGGQIIVSSSNVSLITHTHSLDGLSDVVITAAVNGDLLSFDGVNWVNKAPVAANNAFARIANSGGLVQFSAAGEDALQLHAATNIAVAYDDVNKRVTFSGTGVWPEASNAGTLDGLDSTAFALTSHNHDGSYVRLALSDVITAQHTFAPNVAQAPFALGVNAQGQKVVGLNADQLDGNDSSAFALAGHNHNGIYVRIATAETITARHTFNPSTVAGPFIIGANGSGQLVVGLNSDRLDGKHASAFSLVGHTHTLDAGITDVVLTSPVDGQVLTFESVSGNWINENVPTGGSPSLDQLSDVVITTPANNEILAFNTADSTWINQTSVEANLASLGANTFTAGQTIDGGPLIINQPINVTTLIALQRGGLNKWIIARYTEEFTEDNYLRFGEYDNLGAFLGYRVDFIPGGTVSINVGNLLMNNSGAKRIHFHPSGVAAPTHTSYSAGTKIVLYDSVGPTETGYALGIASGTIWYAISAATTSHFHKWYGSTTLLMSLRGDGLLDVDGIIQSSRSPGRFQTSSTQLDLFLSTSTRIAWFGASNWNPGADNTFSLGFSSARFTAVWAVDGTINTSSRDEKENIARLNGVDALDAIMGLPLYRYTMVKSKQPMVGAMIDELPNWMKYKKSGVSSYSMSSLALAGVQGLLDRIQELEERFNVAHPVT